MATHKLLLLPGDGIGPEVMREVEKVVGWFRRNGIGFETETDLVGGAAYDAHGAAISESAMARAQAADAVLFGAVGGPKWADVPYGARPEAGLLRLRKDLGLFANLRPAICYPALADASSLKREVVEGLDIVIVRELTGGVYFGEPKEIVTLENGQQRAVDTQLYTTGEIDRIARVAFELARRRRNKVSSAEKNNVMKSGVLWKQVVTRVHRDYQDVELEHVLADNCAMQLVRWPKQYDVIVTDNLFGDILSDVALGVARRRGPGDRPPQGALRAGARLGAGHRRPRPRQPDRDDRLVCDGVALFLRPHGRRRPARAGDHQSARLGGAHEGHRAARRQRGRHRRDGRRGRAGARGRVVRGVAPLRTRQRLWVPGPALRAVRERQCGARALRTRYGWRTLIGPLKSTGLNGLRLPTNGPLITGSGSRPSP
jgi:3-isopropylmalate dehydrogenase